MFFFFGSFSDKLLALFSDRHAIRNPQNASQKSLEPKSNRIIHAVRLGLGLELGRRDI